MTTLLVTHPRDEAAYLEYVETYADYGSLHKKSRDASRTELVAAGDRACDWLAQRPMALTRTHGDFDLGTLAVKFNKQQFADDPSLPDSITAGAWEYLCPATKALKQPWTPLRDTSAD